MGNCSMITVAPVLIDLMYVGVTASLCVLSCVVVMRKLFCLHQNHRSVHPSIHPIYDINNQNYFLFYITLVSAFFLDFNQQCLGILQLLFNAVF